ncbi:hypothetical protein CDAR_60201 [Caerostris darwini]|uniref:Uncharacterized protein n=1 Tax=Caerostris darwini TaxID=1538125 RepID=A0AAV4QKF6_9ARAC|nr:hypothetical protein CDAR_60201 [Caerostris darwini]
MSNQKFRVRTSHGSREEHRSYSSPKTRPIFFISCPLLELLSISNDPSLPLLAPSPSSKVVLHLAFTWGHRFSLQNGQIKESWGKCRHRKAQKKEKKRRNIFIYFLVFLAVDFSFNHSIHERSFSEFDFCDVMFGLYEDSLLFASAKGSQWTKDGIGCFSSQLELNRRRLVKIRDQSHIEWLLIGECKIVYNVEYNK